MAYQVYFKKNLLDQVRNRDKAWLKDRLNDIFMRTDKHTAVDRLQQLVDDLEERYPTMADRQTVPGYDAIEKS